MYLYYEKIIKGEFIMKKPARVVVVIIVILALLTGGVTLLVDLNQKNIKGKWQVVESGVIDNKEEGNLLRELKAVSYSITFSKGSKIDFMDKTSVNICGQLVDYDIIDNSLVMGSGDGRVIFNIDSKDNNKINLSSDGYKIILEKI